jgi:hypothetical protein
MPKDHKEVASATHNLVETYRELAAHSPIRALSALAAYETQASAIATTRALLSGSGTA